MKRAIFLDRDGTINVEKHYLHKIEEFEFLPGVIESLKLLQSLGYLLIIITNQSGIGRGYYSDEDFQKLNSWMIDELRNQDIEITAVYYCPHLPDAQIEKYRMECNCRKPAVGLYEQAVKDYQIDINESYAVGDKIRDCSICKKTNCRGFLISNNESEDIINRAKHGEFERVVYAESLQDAARMIKESEK